MQNLGLLLPFSMNFCTQVKSASPKTLYKYLLRQCQRLPDDGPRKFYINSVKQSYKQHLLENDPERIQQIVSRAYEDTAWILQKVKMQPLEVYREKMTIESFWNTIMTIHNNPRWIHSGVKSFDQVLLVQVSFLPAVPNAKDFFTQAVLNQIGQLNEISKQAFNHDFIKNMLVAYSDKVQLTDKNTEELESNHDGVYISIQALLETEEETEKIQIIALNKQENIVLFLTVNINQVSGYSFFNVQHTLSGHMVISVKNTESAVKLLINSIKQLNLAKTDRRSLCLISAARYEVHYKDLKKKYARDLVMNWTERTDPLKYVYEDIGIAAYLISLWEKTHPYRKPSFVDLGCGNGLLVHLLNQEGYPGCGIDIRKRKIWDSYPPTTCLKEQIILPNAEFLFPDCDWIIGNHSDELTPWVPVIAARSSYKTNFFLLPCCCYEFNGRKFNRINTGRSTYEDYMEFLHNFCRLIEFVAEKDYLKIPSTKRRCLIGFAREYEESMLEEVNRKIDDFINKRQNVAKDADWTDNIKLRESVEKVKNCTQIDRTVITTIVNKVVSLLLASKNLICTQDGREWNSGGLIPFEQLAQEVGKDLLLQLKSECGGLKTLLKNHRYIFEVLRSVRLRIPTTVTEVGDKYRSKPCWFKINHPNGCCNTGNNCAYNHNL